MGVFVLVRKVPPNIFFCNFLSILLINIEKCLAMEAEDEVQGTYWKNNLYLLQERAPKPNKAPCSRRIFNRPEQYGDEYHGLIERQEAEEVRKENN